MSIDKKYILAGAIASSIMLHTGMTTAFAATEYKVITADAVNFRSGPSTSYSSLGSFNKGDKVEYLGTSGSWVQVKYDRICIWILCGRLFIYKICYSNNIKC